MSRAPDVVAHQLVVHRNARQVAGRRTGRHDDLLGGDDFLTDLDLPAAIGLADEAAVAGQEGDLVLLEQALDAGGELLDDLGLAGDHLGHVDLRRAHGDALLLEAVAGLLEQVG